MARINPDIMQFDGGGTEITASQVNRAIANVTVPAPVGEQDERYYTAKVGTTGKTSAQLAAAENAATTAKLIGGTVDPKTGYVVPPKKTTGSTVVPSVVPTVTPQGTDPALLAMIKSLQDEIAANKAAANIAAQQKALEQEKQRQSTIAILQDRFARYGLSGLANKIKELAIDGATEATITLGLQATDEYKQRFKANEVRIKNGLTVLQPAEYLNLEDGYRQVLRSYGLKAFDNDEYVQQFIANDISAAELSNRVVTAVQRVQNADPAVSKQLRDFYGIGSQDLVAYVLDPQQQFQKIERQVAASEIGVAAGRQGLTVGVGVAEQLAAQGVSMAEAQKGYATIADILPTAEKLSSIYGETSGVTYGQSEAEQEVFNSLASAQRARQRLTSLEVAQFGGQSGLSKAALSTQNQGNF